MHVAINSAKNIVDKKWIGKNRIKLIKRIKTIEDAPTREKLLKAMKVLLPATSGIMYSGENNNSNKNPLDSIGKANNNTFSIK